MISPSTMIRIMTTIACLGAGIVSLSPLAGRQKLPSGAFQVAGTCGPGCMLASSNKTRVTFFWLDGDYFLAKDCTYLLGDRAATIKGECEWRGKRGAFELGIGLMTKEDARSLWTFQLVGPGEFHHAGQLSVEVRR